MSDVRMAYVVAEGRSDLVVLAAILDEVVGPGVELAPLLPQTAPGVGRGTGLLQGWTEVRKWLLAADGRPGGVQPPSDGALLLIHVDADVAETAGSDPPCPPADDGVEDVRRLVLDWAGLQALPADVVLCIPSKGMDTWLLAGLYPSVAQATRNLECSKATKLGWWRESTAKAGSGNGPPPNAPRSEHYAEAARSLDWPSVLNLCPQARRFQDDLLAAVGALRAGA